MAIPHDTDPFVELQKVVELPVRQAKQPVEGRRRRRR
jgi:hypothetical protein